MITLPFVEVLITQLCNLNCFGCSNYSDMPHRIVQSWKEIKPHLEKWNTRINIAEIGIIGGEPLVTDDYKDWLVGLREMYPETRIRFTTNGVLLHKHLGAIDLMQQLGNISFKITVHKTNTNIENSIDYIINKYNWTKINEFGIDRYITDNDFRFHVKRPDTFIKTYKNNYHDMAPWHSDSAQAFDICIQQTCPLMVNDKIYKCSTAGLLEPTLERFGNPNFDQWKKYIPTPITYNSTDEKLLEFVENFGKPHKICGQCPTAADSSSYINHLTTVTDGTTTN